MSIFEGKSPAERYKIIAAIVLGTLAVISLVYTFGGSLWSRGPSSSEVTTVGSPSPDSEGTGVSAGQEVTLPDQNLIYEDYKVAPVVYSGARVNAPITGRNIFAFYEPPPFNSGAVTPEPAVTFTPLPPTPEAPIMLSYVSPGNVYAGSTQFRIEAVGDKFTEGTRIVFNGSALPTSFVSPQRLLANVPASLITRSGTGSVFVNTPDGSLYSYPVSFTVMEPPRPDFEYIGLIARQHYNNDTAYFQDRGRRNEDPFTARLNDVVKGRFRVISISPKEVEFEDIRLGFKHKLPLLRPDESTGSTSVPSTGEDTPFNNRRSIPGIPDNIPRTIPGQPVNPIRRDVNRPINRIRPDQKIDDGFPDSVNTGSDIDPPARQ